MVINRHIDFGKTASDYGTFRAGFPEALYDRLADFGIGETGQRLLDLGAGAGYLGRGFARAGCAVTGLDPSEAMIDEARRLDSEADVAIAGFQAIESFSFDVHTPYSHQAWRGRVRASAGVGASLAPDAVERFDGLLAELLAKRFPEDPLTVLHRCFALVCRAP